MRTGRIPVYVLIPDEDAGGIFNVLAEAGPTTKEASYSGIRSAPEAIHHASNLDKDQWYQWYLIIVDRPQWKTADGVLVVNMDFEGGPDGELRTWLAAFAACSHIHLNLTLGVGLRMPASEAAVNIASMSIGNTDWEGYIATSRSRYTRVPQNYFAVYIDRAIPDAEDVLGFGRTLIDAGFKGRKKNLGSVCCAVEDLQPSDVGDVACHHRGIAEKLGCNGQFGCFIEAENWSFLEGNARIFSVQRNGQLDSFIMDIAMVGETLNSVVAGSGSWEEEKALRAIHP